MFFSNYTILDSLESAVEKSFSGSSTSETSLLESYENDKQINTEAILKLFGAMNYEFDPQVINKKLIEVIDGKDTTRLKALYNEGIKSTSDKSAPHNTLRELNVGCIRLYAVNALIEKLQTHILKDGQLQNRQSKSLLDNFYHGASKIYKQFYSPEKTEDEVIEDLFLTACWYAEVSKQEEAFEKLTLEKIGLLVSRLIPCLQKIWEEQEIAIEKFKEEQKAVVAVCLIRLIQSLAQKELKIMTKKNFESE